MHPSNVALLFLLLIALMPPASIRAATPPYATVAIDGETVYISVLTRGHTISEQTRNTRPWWEWGNTTSDVYVFAINNINNPHMIIEFRKRDDGRPEALIYTSERGRQPVAYTFEDGLLTVQAHGGHPYLTIYPEQGSWLEEGRTNYNLNLLFDGHYTFFGDSTAPTDGVTDVQLRIGSRQPGIPEWEVMRLLHDAYPNRAYLRFGAAQRMASAPPFEIAPPFMPTFPYFDIGNGVIDGKSQQVDTTNPIDWFSRNPQPIYLTLKGPELLMLPLVSGQIGGNYYVSSISPEPYLDFESPFAFYSFDPTTRYAQLVVRAFTFPATSQIGPAARSVNNVDRTSFRYSWKTASTTHWTYSLQVAGTEPYAQEMELGDTYFVAPGPDELPTWIAHRQWPLVSFIEATQGYLGSEGIYYYTNQSDDALTYLAGESDAAPNFFQSPYLPETTLLTRTSELSLPPSFRGEYSLTYNRKPRLYFSPVDGRLHLLYAEGGVWNLGSGVVLRSHNLDGDAYIDGWTRERITPPAEPNEPLRATPGVIEEALYVVGDYLIYSGPSGGQIRMLTQGLASFEIDPPTDKASWLAFRERLTLYAGQTRDPNNLRYWMEALSGTAVLVTDGPLTNLRTTAEGFQLTANLQPGYSIAPVALPGGDLSPGSYVVSYDNAFSFTPAAEPTFILEIEMNGRAQITRPATLRALTLNGGNVDASGLRLVAEAIHKESKSQALIGDLPLTALAGEPAVLPLEWLPDEPGQWTIRVDLLDSSGSLLASSQREFEVAGASASSLKTSLTTIVGHHSTLPVVILLVLFSSGLLMITRGVFREHRKYD